MPPAIAGHGESGRAEHDGASPASPSASATPLVPVLTTPPPSATADGWRPVPKQDSVHGIQFQHIVWTGSPVRRDRQPPTPAAVFLDSSDGMTWNLQSGYDSGRKPNEPRDRTARCRRRRDVQGSMVGLVVARRADMDAPTRRVPDACAGHRHHRGHLGRRDRPWLAGGRAAGSDLHARLRARTDQGDGMDIQRRAPLEAGRRPGLLQQGRDDRRGAPRVRLRRGRLGEGSRGRLDVAGRVDVDARSRRPDVPPAVEPPARAPTSR